MGASDFCRPKNFKTLALRPYRGLDDFTLYFPANSANSSRAHNANLSAIRSLLGESRDLRAEQTYSYSENINLRNAGEFRCLICPCFRGEQYSLTLRKAGGSYKSKKLGGRFPANPVPAKVLKSSRPRPRSGYAVFRDSPPPNFLFGRHRYVDALFQAIFRKDGKPTGDLVAQAGLVIVAGSTATSKSRITQGLIYKYLIELIKTRNKPQHRRPHLVTFEDPIETLYYQDPEVCQQHAIDYTPRQKGIDASDLRSTLRDCLRQTPDAVYVGETRDLKDWPELIDFAGTGHLLFTTCHAGSLTEIMNTIFSEVQANSAARRSSLASRLVAVIHLRRCTLEQNGTGISSKIIPVRDAILPAVWKRTPNGINALGGDGLAALLPHGIAAQQERAHYCYGRNYFANELTKGKIRLRTEDLKHVEFYKSEIRRLAVQFDLEGL